MVKVLENLLFLSEYCENGVSFLLGKCLSDEVIYRWEPLATKMRGLELRMFKNGLEKRNRILKWDSKKSGILPLKGPVYYQEQFWLGWEARSGESLFDVLKKRELPLAVLVENTLPLIHSYHLYHQVGLIVGRPDWNRLLLGKDGIFMPDPYGLPYLSSFNTGFPNELIACRPPELFSGKLLDQYGDRFYLGLLLFFMVTGKIPYSLSNGWPTKDLLTGKVISPVIFRPELNPLIAGTIVDLLSKDQTGRTSAKQVDELWNRIRNQKEFLASPQALVFHLRKRKRYYRKNQLHDIWNRLKIGLVVLIIICLGAAIVSPRLNRKQSIPSPVQEVRTLYHNLSNPSAAFETRGNRFELFADFIKARESREKLASEIFTHPLVEVEKVHVISKTSDRVVIETVLGWWNWSNGSWSKQCQPEKLILLKKADHWVIQNRQKI